MTLAQLRELRSDLVDQYAAAVRDGDWDRECTIGHRQIMVDEQIEKEEQRIMRAHRRQTNQRLRALRAA